MSGLARPAHLDELLNYRLLRLYAASGAPVLRLLEGRYGISRREWRLLALLARHGEMSPSRLASQAHLDRPRATRGLQVLVEKKLAVRIVDERDRRRARLGLTPSGRRLYDEVFPQVARINAELVGCLDQATLEALDRALVLLTGEAERLNGERVRDVQTGRHRGSTDRRREWP